MGFLFSSTFRRVGPRALAFGMASLVGLAAGQGSLSCQGAPSAPGVAPSALNGTVEPIERGISEWLMRMHEASRLRSYMGTFIVSSNAGALSSAKIWHVCEAEQQAVRIEALTGTPRSTFRHNDQVITFLPESRVVRMEKRESLGLFPDLLKSNGTAIPEFYAARRVGNDRVAGFDADVVQLAPKDGLRFGYRIWSEKKTALVVKLQTLGIDGNVLEQAAFSELQLDTPLKMNKLVQMMAVPDHWQVEKVEAVKTSAAAEGWALKTPVAGFKSMSCYKRAAASGGAADGTMQWIFSDGLASVSLFVEAYDRQRHTQEGLFAAGATQTLTRRIQNWWLTVVGEVPPQALDAFAQSLERRK